MGTLMKNGISYSGSGLPEYTSADAEKVLKVNSGGSGLEWAEGGGGTTGDYLEKTNPAGTGSLKLGTNTTLSSTADNAVVLGDNCTAAGKNSLAGGEYSVASNRNAVAFGTSAQAHAPNAIAIGNNCQTVATAAVALGTSCVVRGEDGFAAGKMNVVNSWGSVALGYANEVYAPTVSQRKNAEK